MLEVLIRNLAMQMCRKMEKFMQQVMDVGLLSACFIEDALQYQLNLTLESRSIKNVHVGQIPETSRPTCST